MTPTPHGQVPEALRLAHIFDNPLPPEWPDMVAAAAELRRQHARIAELEAVGAGGVQALSAAPAIGDELRDTLVAVSAAIAERDDRAAQKMICEILAASTTPPAEQQATKETSGGFHVWRDISTAPKDGSRFVAIGYNYGLYSEGRHICVAQWFRGCWMETSDWNEASELQHLTHWLPLPSPPDNAAELNDLDVSVSPQQAAPKAAPGDQRKAFESWARRQSWIKDCGKAPDGNAYGHWDTQKAWLAWAAALAAPQQEAQEPSRAAKTWCSYVAGMIGCYLNEPDESTKVQAIAGIIERRLWALPTPQPAPDCHHRPPCNECAALAAKERQP